MTYDFFIHLKNYLRDILLYLDHAKWLLLSVNINSCRLLIYKKNFYWAYHLF